MSNHRAGRVRKAALALAASGVASLALSGPALADTSGAFVVGDGNAQIGQTVEFWGAQWSKDNQISTGAAPSAFKGWVPGLDAFGASCTLAWTGADPGASAPPPVSVGENIVVYAVNSVQQAGSVISGKALGAYNVTVTSDYEKGAGHTGLGTITSPACGGPAGLLAGMIS